jgi:hypothetical protein
MKKEILISILVAVILMSCGRTTKDITSHRVKSDSSAEQSIKKKGIATTEGSAISQKDSSYENDIVLVFDNDQPVIETDQPKEDPVEKAIDLPGPAEPSPKPKKEKHHYNFGGVPISSPVPIKSATLHSGGKVTELKASDYKTKDSGQLEEHKATKVTKEDTGKERHVVRTGIHIPWYVWVLSILILVVSYLLTANKKRWFPFNDLLQIEELLKQES